MNQCLRRNSSRFKKSCEDCSIKFRHNPDRSTCHMECLKSIVETVSLFSYALLIKRTKRIKFISYYASFSVLVTLHIPFPVTRSLLAVIMILNGMAYAIHSQLYSQIKVDNMPNLIEDCCLNIETVCTYIDQETRFQRVYNMYQTIWNCLRPYKRLGWH